MSNTLRYDKSHESELLSLLKAEPDWSSFTSEDTLEIFRDALLNSETYICQSHGRICGYLRALVDGFGIYISELYVAPPCRNKGKGKELLNKIRQQHPNQEIYILSDEDLYYEKLGCKRVGTVFQL